MIKFIIGENVMKLIKKNIIALLCGLIIIGVFFNLNKISDKVAEALIKQPTILLEDGNSYQKDYDFDFVKNTTNFMPYSYNDILNIYYTLINKGIKNFSFYCPSEYKECLNDLDKISDAKEGVLPYLNHFVHPFNNFENIITSVRSNGEINITINYLYTDYEKKMIEEKADQIIAEVITKDMSDYDKIKTIHDYIINHTKYDIEQNDKGTSNYLSYKAYGPLLQGYATCNGYTDAMAIFLTKFKIKNFKVATELIKDDASGHIWNAVYLPNQNKWLHLDLTWDDPVDNPSSPTGKDYLQHKYFLITTSELEKVDQGEVIVKEHLFNKSIFHEMENSNV